MSRPRYPSYRDAGELGCVPSEWRLKPLHAVASYNDDVLPEDTSTAEQILYVDISSVTPEEGIVAKEELAFGAAPSRARRMVKHGDTIVSTVRTYLKAVARIRDPEPNLVVSTGFAVIRPRRDLNADYLSYLLSSDYFVEQVIARSVGVSYTPGEEQDHGSKHPAGRDRATRR